MSTFTYEKQGGIFRILKNGKPVNTPKGAAVVTDNEHLVQQLTAELNSGRKYTNCDTLLCYHYTYCDLAKEYSQQAIAKDLCTYCKTDLENDEFLMFNQKSEQSALQYYKRHLPNVLRQYTMPQLVAVMVVLVSFDSLLLSHHFVNEVIAKGNTDEALSQFILDLKMYFMAADETLSADDEELAEYLRMISLTIKAFAQYFALK